MFDGFFTRIRTIMGLGAAHGRRGFPRDEHGIAIPVWGDASTTSAQQAATASLIDATDSANVTPIAIAGGKSNG